MYLIRSLEKVWVGTAGVARVTELHSRQTETYFLRFASGPLISITGPLST